jgi:ABC-2 type transport system ATP-binding protein
MDMAAEPLISTNKLSKKYAGADTLALHDLTISVQPGEVYGFLGANGAGKSTTIRTLLGFLRPTGGSARICGLDAVRDSVAAKQHVGYLAGDAALYQKMTGHEMLEYLQKLQPLKHAEYFAKLSRDFDADLAKPIQQLSKGNRQKIGLLQAFMHEPDVLILDEPTSGLDPLMQEVFARYVKEAKARGAAVFLSSHNLAEAQNMCDRVGIIRAGKLLKEQRVDELSESSAQRFTITFSGNVPKDLAEVDGTTLISQTGNSAVVQVVKNLSPLLAFLATKKVTRLSSAGADLEDEFLQFYGEENV